jgi:hypothetical protein
MKLILLKGMPAISWIQMGAPHKIDSQTQKQDSLQDGFTIHPNLFRVSPRLRPPAPLGLFSTGYAVVGQDSNSG